VQNEFLSQKISFCTSCGNRLWQLRETLPANLQQLPDDDELVIVDYGSSDGLSDWIWSNFHAEIHQGKIVFFETSKDVRWSSPRAKNLAHRLANKDYLFNLDADGFITTDDIAKISSAAQNGDVCRQWSEEDDGSFGRIGLPTALFYTLGGYDETLLPMTWQDVDFLERLALAGKRATELGSPEKKAIQNTIGQKMAFAKRSAHPAHNMHREFQQINRSISNFKITHEGPYRRGGFATFEGWLNGLKVRIDGFNNVCHFAQPKTAD
jgi:glycosyltransferase involved in cell wall biosynthesis